MGGARRHAAGLFGASPSVTAGAGGQGDTYGEARRHGHVFWVRDHILLR